MNHNCTVVVMTVNLNMNYHRNFDCNHNHGNPYYMKVDMPLDMMELIRDMVVALAVVVVVAAMAVDLELDKVLHEKLIKYTLDNFKLIIIRSNKKLNAKKNKIP